MSFDYRRQKGSSDHGSMWTSYSDLFLGLSIIFLLLYVVASLRQGTNGVQQQIEMQKMARENEDLKQQIKVYDTLKQEYLQTSASEDENKTYSELIDKLNLLQDQAKTEKNDLRAKAMENERKEAALNKYQQMIRNIINSNMVAQARIKRRDLTIGQKDVAIAANQAEISQLEKSVAEKKKQIAEREQKIATVEGALDKRMSQLRSAYKSQQITKKRFDQRAAEIKAESERRLETLRVQNEQAERQLTETAQRLSQTSGELASTSGELQKTKGDLMQSAAERAKLEQQLQGLEAKSASQLAQLKSDLQGKNAAQIAGLKGQFEAQRAADKAAFEEALGKEKLSGAAKAAREAQFRAESERKAKDLGDKIAGLNSRMQDTEGKLARAQENLNARKNVAQQIKARFAANGIKADVDEDTGDVLLSFGDHYFDTGRADLKKEMQAILVKAMPIYSASLFENQKIADKIQSVEIVGYASPTYKGKLVNPNSLSQLDRKAVNFNLDLSYARARSIFNYVFDTDKISFKHQQQLLPLVKVTGRSFLAEGNRSPAADKCEGNECAKKAQRVIIKFTLKD